MFKYEDCLLKHYIRKEVWLPVCHKRLEAIREASSPKYFRRLKYFTFCAVGALDVLLLDREKVIRQSRSGNFDTVVFFDRDSDAVSQTNERIPGAIGFPDDFVDVVLLDDPRETDEIESLYPPSDEEDVRGTRAVQIRRDIRKNFIGHFPFDVLNLDVERYLFQPKEELPGKLVNVIRKILDWQKHTGLTSEKKEYSVKSFDLMLTTRVGPHDLPDDYQNYLKGRIDSNLLSHDELREPFERRSGAQDAETFFSENFEDAFKLAIPKSLADLVFECDWYVDEATGIRIYEFSRETMDEPYTMLHMVFTVHRQNPAFPRRAPGAAQPEAAVQSHVGTIMNLFRENSIRVEKAVAGKKRVLKADLQRLFEHRDRYLNATPPA